MLLLTREYRFSAAHQRRCAALSDEANLAAYGECTRLHWHNYRLLVSIVGSPDATGRIADLRYMDEAVEKWVRIWDSNRVVLPASQNAPQTVENMVLFLVKHLPPEVAEVTLHETDRISATWRRVG